MNRHALRSALGRGTPSSSSSTAAARALSLPISTTTPTSFFSTTPSRPAADENNNNNSKPRSQNAAVERLTQLNNNNNNRGTGGGPKKETLDSIPSLSSSSSSTRGGGGFRPGSGIIDARSLRVSPAEGASSSLSATAPRVLNLRSLRGGGGGLSGRVPFGRGGGIGAGRAAAAAAAAAGGGGGAGGAAGGEGGGFVRPRFGFVAGAPQRGGFSRGGRFGGLGGGPGGGGGFGDRSARGGGAGRFGARGGRGRGRGRGGRGGAAREARVKKPEDNTRYQNKLVWSPEEKAVMDRLDQGEMVPFDPKLTLDSLSGYGAALATDAPIGQVESALRAMRLMTGGMAFNAESGVTADVKAIIERYKQKKPVFVHSKEEKAWIESSQPRLRLVGPNAETKKAIVDTAILGQYKGTTFAEAGDVKATMANYHARTFTYMASDSQKFMDKVISLLPAQGGGKPAAQAPKP